MTTGQKWLTGCGIGCGVLLLAGIGACVAGALFMKHTFRGIEKAAESQEALVGELGGVEDYAPPGDGAPAADRLEMFVQIREGTADARREVDAAAARLPPPELSEEEAVIGKIRLGLDVLGDLIDSIGTYLQARNHALMERGMGLGEYVYLYSLTYHSWLGHPPGEAPEMRQGPDGVRVGVFDDNNALFSEEAVRRRYRRYVLGMVREQMASVGPESVAAEAETWRTRLEREIQRLEVDPGRVLWQDGLPEDLETALEPFRQRLEATWSASTNRVELPLAEHETPWEWR
jgi:hypothetical protein